MTALGLLAALFYLAHAIEVLIRWPAANLLWTCNVAAALVAAGTLARAPLANASGGFMLLLGEPFWIIEILPVSAGGQGGDLAPTSFLTHIGSPIIALIAMRRMGLPRFTWCWTVAGIAAITLAARLVGPPSENVNLAHRIPPGWESIAPSHAAYMLGLTATLALGSLLLQLALRRLGFPLPLHGNQQIRKSGNQEIPQ